MREASKLWLRMSMAGGREGSGFYECCTKSEQVQGLQLLMPPSKELDPKY